MKAFSKPTPDNRQPIYAFIAKDTKSFIKELARIMGKSEGQVIDIAINHLKEKPLK